MTTPPGDQPPYGEPSEPPYPPQQPYPGAYQGGYQQPGQPGQPYPPPGQQPYQQPYPPYGYPVAPPEHPKAMTSMVLGILGLVMCQIASPFAWAMGKRTVAEIDASGGRLGGRGQAQTGYILGIVGTCLLGVGVVFLLIWFVGFIVLALGTAAS
jgi:hypothetical protein